MKRWPIIRHVRWAWLTLRFSWWWSGIAPIFPGGPNPADIAYLKAVWRGEA